MLKVCFQSLTVPHRSYPLYLRQNAFQFWPEKKQVMRFENGVVLLDRNIQYILYSHGYTLTQGSNQGQILNIAPLFDLSIPLNKNIGKPFFPQPKLQPPSETDIDLFDVLSLC